VFGAGGGTSSYREIEETEMILLWGSNARETHPIFFHHVLKGIRNGAKLYVIDPRRTSSAQWADTWLGLDVGSDISLANAMAREIIHSGLANEKFIQHATSGFDAYRACVEQYALERAELETGVPAEVIRQTAHAYANAKRAQICWTLGITEHHNAVDNVLALVNLALLTGHVGRYASGVNPLRGQNNVQGGGDMGAIPDRLPGFQNVENAELRAKFERAYGAKLDPERGLHLSGMFEAMERGELTTLYVLGENPIDSEADRHRAVKLMSGLEFLVVQDLFYTKTAELAHVILPGSAGWCETAGTVTSSERRVQRVRAAVPLPEGVRDDMEIIYELANRLGRNWGKPDAQAIWNELRSLSPMHAGMSYKRLEELGGIQWPCYDESHPGELYLHSRLWREPLIGPRAPFSVVEFEPPVDELNEEYPIRLTTGRHLDSYNTGEQSRRFPSPLRRAATLDLSPEDGKRYQVCEGEQVRVSSRRGSVLAPVRFDPGLRPGLAFLAVHFHDEIATNDLTIDAVDPKSGTSEFKATAIRIEKCVENSSGPAPH
jgi:predicted molibdopterin-dependent oxidoreductase YjgC